MEMYLVWSNEHGAWWREKCCGYTSRVENAGRYTHEEALKHCRGRDQDPHKPLPELPVKEADVMTITGR